MDEAYVPSKVNRHIIKAISTLTEGNVNVFVPHEHIVEQVKYQMRRLKKVTNEYKVIDQALKNLTKIGLLRQNQWDFALPASVTTPFMNAPTPIHQEAKKRRSNSSSRLPSSLVLKTEDSMSGNAYERRVKRMRLNLKKIEPKTIPTPALHKGVTLQRGATYRDDFLVQYPSNSNATQDSEEDNLSDHGTEANSTTKHQEEDNLSDHGLGVNFTTQDSEADNLSNHGIEVMFIKRVDKFGRCLLCGQPTTEFHKRKLESSNANDVLRNNEQQNICGQPTTRLDSQESSNVNDALSNNELQNLDTELETLYEAQNEPQNEPTCELSVAKLRGSEVKPQDSEANLQCSEPQLQNNEAKLQINEAELQCSDVKMQNSEKKLQSSEAMLLCGEENWQINEANLQITEAMSISSVENLQLNDAKFKIDEAKLHINGAQLQSSGAELEGREATFPNSEAELQSREATFSNSEAELQSSEAKLQSNETGSAAVTLEFEGQNSNSSDHPENISDYLIESADNLTECMENVLPSMSFNVRQLQSPELFEGVSGNNEEQNSETEFKFSELVADGDATNVAEFPTSIDDEKPSNTFHFIQLQSWKFPKTSSDNVVQNTAPATHDYGENENGTSKPHTDAPYCPDSILDYFPERGIIDDGEQPSTSYNSALSESSKLSEIHEKVELELLKMGTDNSCSDSDSDSNEANLQIDEAMSINSVENQQINEAKLQINEAKLQGSEAKLDMKEAKLQGSEAELEATFRNSEAELEIREAKLQSNETGSAAITLDLEGQNSNSSYHPENISDYLLERADNLLQCIEDVLPSMSFHVRQLQSSELFEAVSDNNEEHTSETELKIDVKSSELVVDGDATNVAEFPTNIDDEKPSNTFHVIQVQSWKLPKTSSDNNVAQNTAPATHDYGENENATSKPHTDAPYCPDSILDYFPDPDVELASNTDDGEQPSTSYNSALSESSKLTEIHENVELELVKMDTNNNCSDSDSD